MFLLKVIQAFQKARVKFALCGGQAVALHGAVRGTVDIDFVIQLNKSNLEAAEKTLLQDLGLVSRIPVRSSDILKFRKEYIQKKNLTAWSFVNPQRLSEAVDLLITDDLEEYSIVYKEAWGTKIPLVSLADLIAMKLKSGRPQDLADVEALKILLTHSKGAKKK